MIEAYLVLTVIGFLTGAIVLMMLFTFKTYQTCMDTKIELEAFKKSTHRIQYVNPYEQLKNEESKDDLSQVMGEHERDFYTRGVDEDMETLLDQMEDDEIIYDSRSAKQ